LVLQNRVDTIQKINAHAEVLQGGLELECKLDQLFAPPGVPAFGEHEQPPGQ
jgi:hypothetical protein